MTKNEFIEKAASEIRWLLPDELREEISIRPVTIVKINDQKLNGLAFEFESGKPAPTLYFDDMYEAYCSGMPMEPMMQHVAEQLQDIHSQPDVAPSPEFDASEISNDFKMRVVEIKRNREYLKDRPYMTVGNGMALVADFNIHQDESGSYTTPVTNNLMEMKGLTKEEVFKAAMSQAFDIDKPMLMSMQDKMFGFEDNLLEPGYEGNKESELFILSNESGVFGAASLFYPYVQNQIAEVLGEDYYALPSSLHEWIVVPESANITEDQLAMMVKEANESTVEAKDILSYQVLKYDKEKQRLQPAADARNMVDKTGEDRCLS